MNPTARPHPLALFTLRLWQEPLRRGQSEWRGEIKNLTTGEVRYFRTWGEIADLVPGMLGDIPPAARSDCP